jgi:hypothetical protein
MPKYKSGDYWYTVTASKDAGPLYGEPTFTATIKRLFWAKPDGSKGDSDPMIESGGATKGEAIADARAEAEQWIARHKANYSD